MQQHTFFEGSKKCCGFIEVTFGFEGVFVEGVLKWVSQISDWFLEGFLEPTLRGDAEKPQCESTCFRRQRPPILPQKESGKRSSAKKSDQKK